MAAEKSCGVPVHMVKGSYENIKITTPEDPKIEESFLKHKRGTCADGVVKKER